MTRCLTYAQDLEPRSAGKIREIIENAGRSSSEDEEEEEEQEEVEAEEELGMSD